MCKITKKTKYLPFRFVTAIGITAIALLFSVAVVVALCVHAPQFYLLAYSIQTVCAIKVIASDYNPDYKIPWLLLIMVLPIVGLSLYFIFYSRKLKGKDLARLNGLKPLSYEMDDLEAFKSLNAENKRISNYAQMLCQISDTNLFTHTKVTYFSDGQKMFLSMLKDVESAEKFIYLEYFIVEEGEMLLSLLMALRKKTEIGVDVRFIYDDIGCICTLPTDYCKTLKNYGISATPFSRLKGGLNGEFNNRNHRKMLIIDGKVGYTGGINIADEYINLKRKYGYWKDGGVKLTGNAVWQLTNLFLMDYGLNAKSLPKIDYPLYPNQTYKAKGFVLPFGDGPRPLYTRNVGKTAIRGLFENAVNYVYLTTPYLIIDNELCSSIENAALRGVDIKIILPHVPDKKTVLAISRSFYPRLMETGVKIYEYESGFIHGKNYISDDICAITGTINLDYRSLVHHFENGVFMYGVDCIADMKADFDAVLRKSIRIERDALKVGFLRRFAIAVARLFAPLL